MNGPHAGLGQGQPFQTCDPSLPSSAHRIPEASPPVWAGLIPFPQDPASGALHCQAGMLPPACQLSGGQVTLPLWKCSIDTWIRAPTPGWQEIINSATTRPSQEDDQPQ